MSGHSKWANIKARKGAQDKKRSTVFTRLSRNILTAIREGGGNFRPESNSFLRAAIEKAKGENMPRENIERLLTRFEERGANLAEYFLEGYGPLGVPLVVEVETDNKNRTLGEIRQVFRNHGGSLGEEGCVMYQFDKRYEVTLVGTELSEERQLELIDLGADDFDGNKVLVLPDMMSNFINGLKKIDLKVESQEKVLKAKSPVMLANEEEVAKIMEMVEELEEMEDVINVFSGFDYREGGKGA